MITIHTKQVRNTFFCYATIGGYDFTFSGDSIPEAQLKMCQILVDSGEIYNCTWALPDTKQNTPTPSVDTKPPVTMQRDRIDTRNNIV